MTTAKATNQGTTPTSFGEAEHGVRWAISQLPGGRSVDGRHEVNGESLVLVPFPAAKDEDDYAIAFAADGIQVRANSAVGAISGLLKLGEQLAAGKRKDVAASLRLRTRNYKIEAHLTPRENYGVVQYTDAMWEALCQQLVRHQFNGVVLYSGYHPFEAILDYQERPDAASVPEADRTMVRAGIRRALAMMHKYGLKTFIQHYVGHFTKELAAAHDIPINGRCSNTVHPAVEAYCRYCYREIFKQVPELDGLYFNFESFQNAHAHLLATAIPECNAMARKPIFVFRLWGYTDYNGMEQMLQAYQGRVILGHKIIDTMDAYYLPCADSRVMEWKKRMGAGIEWMFLVGPCHNTGTNLCDQLWADYGFVQTLLADAQAKGADSISFHSVHELFSADLPEAAKMFSRQTLELSRFDHLHLLAASDYVNNVKRSQAEQARTMARLCGVPEAAGRHLLQAIHSSSQLILLAYQQFAIRACLDGWLRPPRYSNIQEPFFYFPASTLSHQSEQPLLFPEGWGAAWVKKTIDTAVAPEGEYQYIIDYVAPGTPKARLNPQVMADLLDANVRQSRRSLTAYRRAAGDEAADLLAPYLERNAIVGEHVRHEILAGIQLYQLYYTSSQPEMEAALRSGLKELQAAAALIVDRSNPGCKNLRRTLTTPSNPDIEIKLAKELLDLVAAAGKVPLRGFAAYVESHKQFNEVRRQTFPMRPHSEAIRECARTCITKAMAAADVALAELAAPEVQVYRQRVQVWRDYLAVRHADTFPPAVACHPVRGTPVLPMRHEDAFRFGEDFLEDFLGFFRPVDFVKAARLSAQVSRTATELVVRLHEDGTSMETRRKVWEECHRRGEGSDSFVMRLDIDVEGKGCASERITVWPAGGGITYGRQVQAPGRVELRAIGDGWDLIAYLPFTLLGRTPATGDTWGFNIHSNPFAAANMEYTWASQFESHATPAFFGKITF